MRVISLIIREEHGIQCMPCSSQIISEMLCEIHTVQISPSADSKRAVVSYWRKYVHEVLVNRLGRLNLSRKSVVRLTDRPDMTSDIYCGRKITTQQIKRIIHYQIIQFSINSKGNCPCGHIVISKNANRKH